MDNDNFDFFHLVINYKKLNGSIIQLKKIHNFHGILSHVFLFKGHHVNDMFKMWISTKIIEVPIENPIEHVNSTKKIFHLLVFVKISVLNQQELRISVGTVGINELMQ